MADTDRNLDVAKLAYEEAIRTLSEQHSSLESIRSRASTNVAVIGLATAFLGQEVIARSIDTGIGVVVLLGLLGSFLASVSLSILVLRSGSGWTFSQSANTIVEDYLDHHGDMPLVQVYRTLAGFLEENADENERALKRLLERLNLAFSATMLHILVSVFLLAISASEPP